MSIAPDSNSSLKAPFGWAGGKSRQISIIRQVFPATFSGRYIEPFLGAGTVLLDRLQAWDGQKVTFIAADLNDALINFWICLQHAPKELMQALENDKFKQYNASDKVRKQTFNKLRDEFNSRQATRYLTERAPNTATRRRDVHFAALFFYLIKTSFNAVWRLSKDGRLTSGPGHAMPRLYDPDHLLNISQFLQRNNVQFFLMDFFQTVTFARHNDIIYCDPPFDSSKDVSAAYVRRQGLYNNVDFQTKIRDVCLHLCKKQVKVIASNSDTVRIRTLFKGWNIKRIPVRNRLGKVWKKSDDEVLIKWTSNV